MVTPLIVIIKKRTIKIMIVNVIAVCRINRRAMIEYNFHRQLISVNFDCRYVSRCQRLVRCPFASAMAEAISIVWWCRCI